MNAEELYDVRMRRRRRWTWIGGIVALVVVSPILVHVLVSWSRTPVRYSEANLAEQSPAIGAFSDAADAVRGTPVSMGVEAMVQQGPTGSQQEGDAAHDAAGPIAASAYTLRATDEVPPSPSGSGAMTVACPRSAARVLSRMSDDLYAWSDADYHENRPAGTADYTKVKSDLSAYAAVLNTQPCQGYTAALLAHAEAEVKAHPTTN